jgi:hypothetical protein
VEYLNVKNAGTYSYHYTLKGLRIHVHKSLLRFTRVEKRSLRGSMDKGSEIRRDATRSPAGLEATDCEGITPDHDISMTETRLL